MTTVLTVPFFFLLFILLLRIVLRRQWLAVTVFVLIMSSQFVARPVPVWITLPIGLALFSAISIAAVRYGLVSLMVLFLFSTLDKDFPLTTDLSAWYAGRSVFAIIIFSAIAIYGFYIALAGRPLFGRLEEP